jgi:hypothetical protein
MDFSENQDHSISLEDAKKLTANYRDWAGEDAIIATSFGKTALNKILSQSGCIGIRMYYGRTDNDDPAMVLVGIAQNGNDLIGGELAELGADCPPFCASPNALNS